MKTTLEAPRIEAKQLSSSCPERSASPLPPRSSALFPPRDNQKRWDDFLSRQLARADDRIAAGAVAPTIDLARFKRDLADFDFETPRALPGVLEWTIAQMQDGIVHVTHPRYFGLFNPAPSFPAQCADRIAATFNPQLASSTTSPVAVEIEAHVVRAVARRAGLPPEASGHFTTGGTEANYSALVCALTGAAREFATRGARAFPGPPTLYASRDSHRAWLKIAHQAGIGRSAVRFVATDGAGRMEPNALADAVRADRAAGCVPVMIVATAGTTNAGMVDPLAECAAIARSAGLWYHVDAAWGGAVIASERLRGLVAGIELADSVTVDAHKWLATTMGCGMFLTARPDALSSAFNVATSYMPSNITDRDPYVTSVQWSRRFLGLRLFLSLAAAGWSGYAAHVEKSVALAQLLEKQLAARGWRVVNDSSLAVLCIEPPVGAGAVRAIVRRVVASGQAWVSEAMFEDRPIIRACVTHGGTTPEDVAALVDALEAAASDCL
jgi:glutamate/tyrosine decarboxylase-like PLP-dependent enzyme